MPALVSLARYRCGHIIHESFILWYVWPLIAHSLKVSIAVCAHTVCYWL